MAPCLGRPPARRTARRRGHSPSHALASSILDRSKYRISARKSGLDSHVPQPCQRLSPTTAIRRKAHWCVTSNFSSSHRAPASQPRKPRSSSSTRSGPRDRASRSKAGVKRRWSSATSRPDAVTTTMSPRPPPSSIASIVTSGPGAFPRAGRAGLAARPWLVTAAPWSRCSGRRRHDSALLGEEVGVSQEAGVEAGLDVERGVELLLEEPHALGAERPALPQQAGGPGGGDLADALDRASVAEVPVGPNLLVQVGLLEQAQPGAPEVLAIGGRDLQPRDAPEAHEGMEHQLLLQTAEALALAPGKQEQPRPGVHHPSDPGERRALVRQVAL